MTSLYLKALGPNREPISGGSGVWPYPAWTPTEPVRPCRSGWHVCTPVQMLSWLPRTDNELWGVKIRGEIVDVGDKTVAGSARLVRKLDWNERTARLFAADCAEHVLHLYEDVYSNDSRPREAIAAAREYADAGAAGAAAWAAAWRAAWAARDAARDAAGVAVWAAAWAAAWAARDARDAAWYAASNAVSAAGYAERQWQALRLLHHIGATP